MVSLFPARQAATGVRSVMLKGIVGGANAALRALHQRCVGCGTQGRSGRPNLRYERWGNRRRGTRRRGAVTAIEWRTARTEPQADVRSTLPEAWAAVSALVRTQLRGAVRSEVRACSAGAPARVQRVVLGVDCPEVNSAMIRDSETRRPLPIRERADRFLQYLADRKPYPGSGFPGLSYEIDRENFEPG